MQVAAIQMVSTGVVQANLAHAAKLSCTTPVDTI